MSNRLFCNIISLSSKIIPHLMPAFSTPCRVRHSKIFKPEFPIHLHLLLQTCQEQAASRSGLPLHIPRNQLSAQSLSAILRQYIKPHQHHAFPLRIMQGNICKKPVPEARLICGNAIEKSCYPARFSVDRHQKQFRSRLNALLHRLS